MECEYEEKQGEAVLKLARDQIASGDPVAALQVRQHGPVFTDESSTHGYGGLKQRRFL